MGERHIFRERGVSRINVPGGVRISLLSRRGVRMIALRIGNCHYLTQIEGFRMFTRPFSPGLGLPADYVSPPHPRLDNRQAACLVSPECRKEWSRWRFPTAEVRILSRAYQPCHAEQLVAAHEQQSKYRMTRSVSVHILDNDLLSMYFVAIGHF